MGPLGGDERGDAPVSPREDSRETGFQSWLGGAGTRFAFQELTLCGTGAASAARWGEKYVSVDTPAPDYGASSWRILRTPPGWVGEIVRGGDPWSAEGGHAFPVWRAETGLPLTARNHDHPAFVFQFRVLVRNAKSAAESDGRVRLWFGGYDDRRDSRGRSPEVSGVLTLPRGGANPTPVGQRAFHRPSHPPKTGTSPRLSGEASHENESVTS